MVKAVRVLLVVMGLVAVGIPLIVGFFVIVFFIHDVFLYDHNTSYDFRNRDLTVQVIDDSGGGESVDTEKLQEIFDEVEGLSVNVETGEVIDRRDEVRQNRKLPPGEYRVSDTVVRKSEFREPSFYYTQDRSVFKVSTDLRQDVLLYANKNAFMYESNKENIMFVELEGDDMIYTLDLSEANPVLKSLVVLPDPNRPDGISISAEELFADEYSDDYCLTVSRVWFVDNGSALAYSTAKCRYPGPSCGEPIIHIVSIPDGRMSEWYVIDEGVRLYNNPHIMAVSDDGKRLYVGHTYEFGLVDYFNVVDRERKEVSVLSGVLGSRESIEDYYVYDFSPDGRHLVIEDLSMEIEQEDRNHSIHYGGDGSVCLDSSIEGVLDKYVDLAGEIIVHDIVTGEKKMVYRNYLEDRNYCKGQHNKITSLKWLDNSRIAFINRDGIYVINIDTKERQTLFEFDDAYDESDFELLSVQMPYILFDDGSVLNTESRKLIRSGNGVKNYQIGRRFFVFR